MTDIAHLRVTVLEDIETRRHEDAEPELEADLSINDWLGRLQSAAQNIQQLCRAGLVNEEYQVWIDVAQIAAGRAELLLAKQL